MRKIGSTHGLLCFPAPDLTPKDSPIQSMEASAVESLQAHLRGDFDDTLDTLILLMASIDRLLVAGVITERLAKMMARGICIRYAEGSW